MKRREITMSLSEFLNMTRENELERLINNKKFKGFLVAGLATGLFIINNNVVFAANPNLSGIDKMGQTFLHIIQSAGYWICLVMALVTILREITKGGDNFGQIGKVILRYIIAFSALYFLPYFFDIVKECFK